MKNLFEVTFPLVLGGDGPFTITFTSQRDETLEFKKGMYYLCGDNGSGKTTFVNMLALIAGRIGKKANNGKGAIKFDGENYSGEYFNHIKAAEIREKSFCIFPQKAFFLPVSTRDNYIILNGSEKKKSESFSSLESPDLLSGGQQQKILMDIVLDDKKPVWFLDEPLTNMDSERRHYFWRTLDSAFKRELRTIFFIDHWIGGEIKNDDNFQCNSKLHVSIETRQKNKPPDKVVKNIEIYENNSPEEFIIEQIQKV